MSRSLIADPPGPSVSSCPNARGRTESRGRLTGFFRNPGSAVVAEGGDVSHARAYAQSASAARGEMPSAAAASATVSPAKYRSHTTSAAWGSIAASRSRASSRARRRAERSGSAGCSGSRSWRAKCPPRSGPPPAGGFDQMRAWPRRRRRRSARGRPTGSRRPDRPAGGTPREPERWVGGWTGDSAAIRAAASRNSV